MEEVLKLIVNYGLGIVFAAGIAIAFFCHLRDEKRESSGRELWFRGFMEKHSIETQRLLTDHDNRAAESRKFYEKAYDDQHDEHQKMTDILNEISTSLLILTKKG